MILGADLCDREFLRAPDQEVIPNLRPLHEFGFRDPAIALGEQELKAVDVLDLVGDQIDNIRLLDVTSFPCPCREGLVVGGLVFDKRMGEDRPDGVKTRSRFHLDHLVAGEHNRTVSGERHLKG